VRPDKTRRVDLINCRRNVEGMEGFATQLRRRGLRNTPQRRAVLIALAEAPHSTVAELAAVVAQAAHRAIGEAGAPAVAGVDGLSRQGLYNVLDDLTRAGLVRCIQPAGSPTRYEVRVGDNHHHLVCRRCGSAEDVSCAVGAAPCLQPAEHSLESEEHKGFVIDEAEVIWWGMCEQCSSLNDVVKADASQ
jgi:Fe2+ or Zn2+ uptake regulation protein